MNKTAKKELFKRGLKFQGKNKSWFQSENDIIKRHSGEKL